MATGTKISAIDLEGLSYAAGTTVVGQPDVPGLSAAEMQRTMENLGRNCLTPKVNEVVQALNETYSQKETDAAIDRKVVEMGAGDMAKAVYDPDGAVESAGGLKAYTKETLQNELQYLKAAYLTLTANGWMDTNGGAPYTQTVEVEGVNAIWVPGPVVLRHTGRGTTEEKIALREQLGYIGIVESGEEELTFTCLEEKPTVALEVYVLGVL